jgi:hypothetical protein
MRIRNEHARALDALPHSAGALIDGLASPNDRLWPRSRWPSMSFDRPLSVGARGGHGPVRYCVGDYVPGRRIAFRFEDSGITAGMRGHHRFEVVEENGHTVLRHLIEARCGFATWAKWLLVIRPLHDALLEDVLDRAEEVLGCKRGAGARWSLWVRVLRRVLSRGPTSNARER